SSNPTRAASQKGELPFVRMMMRFSLPEGPPEPELEQPKGVKPMAMPISNKNLGRQRIVEYLRKTAAHEELLKRINTRAVLMRIHRKMAGASNSLVMSDE